MSIQEISDLLSRVTCHVLGKEFTILIEYDKKYTSYKSWLQEPIGRIYLQIQYSSPCTKTGQMDVWKGRKWYLSDHMTPDEVIKTAYAAFEAAVKHEVMEGFKVDGKILFNPHVNFEALLEITNNEVKRAYWNGPEKNPSTQEPAALDLPISRAGRTFYAKRDGFQ